MNTADKIALFSAVGGWFSAVSTLLAVLVSLYLANRKPKVAISCIVREAFTKSLPFEIDGSNKLTMVLIKVVNHSNFIVRIYGASLEIKDKVVFPIQLPHWAKVELPYNLAYGEDVNFIITSDVSNWVEEMKSALRSNNLNPSKIRCVIQLSTGENFSFPLESKLLAKLKY